MSYIFPPIIIPILELNGGVFGTVKGTDVYPAVDVTDLSQSPTGTTKPYQIIQLINYILDSLNEVTYAPVLAASTVNLESTYNNGIDGVGATLTNDGIIVPFSLDEIPGVVGGRYLIKNQANAAYNGIYILSTLGNSSTDANWVLTRSTDFNTPVNIENNGIVYVQYGATNANTLWEDTFTAPLTVGTTDINWIPFQLVPPFPLSVIYGGTGDESFTPYTVICAGTTSTGSLQNVSGTGEMGQVLTSNGPSNLPTWTNVSGTGTINSGDQYDIAYYATTGTTISGLSTADDGVLVTNGSGEPSISSTLPSGLNIPQPLIGGITSGSSVGAGYVGQLLSDSGNDIPMSTNTYTNITSISVTAGIWILFGNCMINEITSGTFSQAAAGIGTNSAAENEPFGGVVGPDNSFNQIYITAPIIYINITSTTTYYLTSYVDIQSGTYQGTGSISALRVA